MYVAMRNLKANGKTYDRGEPIPAETFKTLRSLLSLGWVVHLPEIEEVEKGADAIDQLAHEVASRIGLVPADPPPAPSTPEGGTTENQGTSDPGTNKPPNELTDDQQKSVDNLLGLTNDEVEKAVKDMTDFIVLKATLDKEERKGAREFIESRITELEGQDK